MAAVLLTHTRNAILPTARASLLATGIAFSSLFAARPSLNWSLMPSPQSILELFPPFLLAVPKKKTSHSRKAMRSANKGLKDKQNIVNCPGCGAPKLSHHLCSACYSYLHRLWKSKNKTDIPDLS